LESEEIARKLSLRKWKLSISICWFMLLIETLPIIPRQEMAWGFPFKRWTFRFYLDRHFRLSVNCDQRQDYADTANSWGCNRLS
jgi:hypothetical protein